MAEKQSKRGWRVATPSANMDCCKINLLYRREISSAFYFPLLVPQTPISNKQQFTSSPMTDKKTQTNPDIFPSEPSEQVATPSSLQDLEDQSACLASFVWPQITDPEMGVSRLKECTGARSVHGSTRRLQPFCRNEMQRDAWNNKNAFFNSGTRTDDTSTEWSTDPKELPEGAKGCTI